MIARPKLFLPRRVVGRPFSVSRPRWEAAALPAKKPVGAFRGGYVLPLLLLLAPPPGFYTPSTPFLTICRIFGFLTGAVVAGASVYYYILNDYRVSNEMLSDDIGVCLLFVPCLLCRPLRLTARCSFSGVSGERFII